MAHSPTLVRYIVIVGGSYAGVSTAHYVLKHVIPALPDQKTFQVVLINTTAEVMCRPACPRALISDDMFPQNKLFVGIPKSFKQYPADSYRFVHGTATQLNHTDRQITVNLAAGGSEQIAFHALVLATGASTPSPLLSFNQDERYLRSCWGSFREALPTAKTIVIAGGGPAGVETAGELGEYLNGRPGWLASSPATPKVQITVVTSGPEILPALRPSVARKAETYLSHVGVTVVKNTRVKSVTPENAGTADLTTNATVLLEDGKTINADLYVPAYGLRPNSHFIDKALLDLDGRVNTNKSTLRVDQAGARIYAIGDVSSYARPAVHIILEAVPVLCANLKRDLLLAEADQASSAADKDRLFTEDTRETQMVPIGKSKGVGVAMGWRMPSILVWAIKGRDYWLWTTGGLWSGQQWAKEKY